MGEIMKKLMVVDDELLVRVGIAALTDWEEHGYTIVAEAADGGEALQKIEQVHPHIVLTDLMMSPMDGVTLIERCQQKYADMKFIVLSNYNDFDNVRRAMKAGASDYVFKLTLKAEELLTVLAEVSEGIDESEDAQHGQPAARRDRTVIKANLLRKLMDARDRYYAEILEQLKSYPLCTSFDVPYRVMTVLTDNFQIVRHRGDFLENDLLKFTMENMIHEIFDMQDRMEIFQLGESGFVLLFSVEPPVQAEELERDFLRLCQHAVRYYGMSLSGVLSGTASGAEGFRALVRRNQETAELRFWGETGRLWLAKRSRAQRKNRLPELISGQEFERRVKAEGVQAGFAHIRKLLDEIRAMAPDDIQAVRKYLLRICRVQAWYLEQRGVDCEHEPDSNGVNWETAVREYDFFEDIVRSLGELEARCLQAYQSGGGVFLRREILEARNFVQAHLGEHMTVARIAESVSMSESRFSHVFKKETGITVLDWVNQIRQEEAQRLLRETEMSVTEIALRIGMENPNYFSTWFRKRCGYTAQEYRRNTQADSRN